MNFKPVIQKFYDLIEEDKSFFHYYGTTPEQALEIAKTRATSYLEEAVSYLSGYITTPKEMGVDLEHNCFLGEITLNEIVLIAKVMHYIYFKRDCSKLKIRVNTFTSSSLKALHSPANERNSFMKMVKDIGEDLMNEVDSYSARDRTTGRLKSINVYGDFNG